MPPINKNQTTSDIISLFRRNRISILSTFFIGVFLLFSLPSDADLGWHLRLGNNIVQDLAFTKQNIFSFTFSNYTWANSYWLSQIVMVLIYKSFGLVGLSLFLSTSLVFLILLLAIKSRETTILNLGLSLTMFFYIISLYHISVRPFAFSTVFMLLLLFILRYKTYYIKYLPFLFLLWANLHADFVIGLGIFSIYTFISFLPESISLWRFHDFNEIPVVTQIKKLSNNKSLLVITIASYLVTLINPYGILLHLTLFKESHPFQFFYVQEWRPLWEGSNNFLIVYCLFIAFLYLYYWKKIDLFSKVLFLLFFTLSIRFSYFSRILLISSFYIFLQTFSSLLKDLSEFLGATRYNLILWFLRFCFVILMFATSISFFTKVNITSDPILWSHKLDYPLGAVNYIKQNNLQGNIYNYYGWGGYLIWRLPENKIFIDGRMPSWRTSEGSVFEDYIKIGSDPDANYDLFREYQLKYDISLALLQRDSKLVSILVSNNWEIIYSDEVSILLYLPSKIDSVL